MSTVLLLLTLATAEPRFSARLVDDTPRASRLAELRAEPPPSLGGSIALLASGVAVTGVTAVTAWLGFSLAFSQSSFALAAVPFLVVAGLSLLVAVPLIVVGAVMLGSRLRARASRTRELHELEAPSGPQAAVDPQWTVVGW